MSAQSSESLYLPIARLSTTGLSGPANTYRGNLQVESNKQLFSTGSTCGRTICRIQQLKDNTKVLLRTSAQKPCFSLSISDMDLRDHGYLTYIQNYRGPIETTSKHQS